MKLLKGLAWTLALLIAGILGAGLLLPDTARLERSLEINAPPATVFVVLNSFRRFQDWSPWRKDDPNAIVTYSGPESGVGARMSWAGEQGGGSQEIVDSKPYSRVRNKLQFEGFERDDYSAEFRLEPVGASATRVVWTFNAEFHSLLGRYFGLLTNALLGDEYDEGLMNLKKLVESLPRADFSKLTVDVVETKPQTLAYVSGTTTTDPADIGTAYAVAYSKVLAYMQQNGLRQAGAPVSIVRNRDETAQVFEYDAGIPINASSAVGAGEVRVTTTYAGKALRVVCKGPYSNLGAAYEALRAYAQIFEYRQNGNLWEEYVSNPATTAEADRMTYLYFPIQ